MGFSFVPFPTAITVPFCGFSFAVSGIIIPDAVFVSASACCIITYQLKVEYLFFHFNFFNLIWFIAHIVPNLVLCKNVSIAYSALSSGRFSIGIYFISSRFINKFFS